MLCRCRSFHLFFTAFPHFRHFSPLSQLNWRLKKGGTSGWTRLLELTRPSRQPIPSAAIVRPNNRKSSKGGLEEGIAGGHSSSSYVASGNSSGNLKRSASKASSFRGSVGSVASQMSGQASNLLAKAKKCAGNDIVWGCVWG